MMQTTSLGNKYAFGQASVMQYHHLLQHIICKQFQIIINHMEITGFINNFQEIITEYIFVERYIRQGVEWLGLDCVSPPLHYCKSLSLFLPAAAYQDYLNLNQFYFFNFYVLSLMSQVRRSDMIETFFIVIIRFKIFKHSILC